MPTMSMEQFFKILNYTFFYFWIRQTANAGIVPNIASKVGHAKCYLMKTHLVYKLIHVVFQNTIRTFKLE